MGEHDVTIDDGDLRAAQTEEFNRDETPTMEIPRVVNAHGYHPGDILWARYRIEEHIGHGGFSEVYRGVDITTDVPVALKFLSARRSEEQVMSRMKRELRLARDLRHPNIVRVHDLIEKDGISCLVMEYVQGRTLKDTIVEDGSMSAESAFKTMSGLCSAVAAVHASGIVHRDLKPQNVILSPEGEVKLLDFGLAKTPESTGLTATGAILGTPDYMSPEQVEGKIADERSDVYSLGVIAYELMVGKPPHTGDTPIAIALQHVRSRIPDVRKTVAGTPDELAQVVKEMTDPKPANRPRTAQAVLMRLDSIGETTAGGATRIIVRKKGKKRRTLGIAAAIVLAVLGGGGFAHRMMNAPEGVASAVDIFADGIVNVAVVMEDPRVSSSIRLFLDAVCRTTSTQLDRSMFNVRELADLNSSNLSDLDRRGLEQLVKLKMVMQNRPEIGNVYVLQAQVVNTLDESVWRTLNTYEMEELDFEAVEPASTHVANLYQAAVAENVYGPNPAVPEAIEEGEE